MANDPTDRFLSMLKPSKPDNFEMPIASSVLGIMLESGPRRHNKVPHRITPATHHLTKAISDVPHPCEAAICYRVVAISGFATFCQIHGYHKPSEYLPMIGLANENELLTFDGLIYPPYATGSKKQRYARESVRKGIDALTRQMLGYRWLTDQKKYFDWRAISAHVYLQLRNLLSIETQADPYTLIAHTEADEMLKLLKHRRVEKAARPLLNAPPDATGIDKGPARPPVGIIEPETALPETPYKHWYRLPNEPTYHKVGPPHQPLTAQEMTEYYNLEREGI